MFRCTRRDGRSPRTRGADKSLRIALIASTRFPIREPFAGGLEAHTWTLASGLRRRGHAVTVYAAAGSDPQLDVSAVTPRPAGLSTTARADVSMTSEQWLQDHHAYLQLMLDLGRPNAPFDVVHNNCLHYLPVATARLLRMPMVTTLHTPPTPWLESAIQAATCPVHFVAVSEHTAAAWRHRIPTSNVIHNGVDAGKWSLGPGDGPAIWSGRIVPEKGTHLAVRAAHRAGIELNIVGPIGDPAYYRSEIQPLLDERIRYVGHLKQSELATRLGQASVCLVTPRWDEPYGLVAAEALACGTPVCGFDRGALSEVVSDDVAVLVPADDVEALAAAIPVAMRLSRSAARRRALTACSADVMIDAYVELYRRLDPR